MNTQLKLGNVQKTLLLPLIGRADISKKHPHFFKDEKAEEIFDNLNFNKKKARRNMGKMGLVAMAVRAKTFDKAITTFLEKHPKATILNVGAGLDTAFWRVDNGLLKWIDLDLPDSLALRKELLPPSKRNPHIAKSVFDESWIKDIGDVSNGLFIQVPGVFPYIEKSMVKDFFENFPQQLSQAEIIFDTVSKLSRYAITQGIKRSGMPKATLKWGVNDAKEVVKWNSNHIDIVEQFGYFDKIDKNWIKNPLSSLVMAVNDNVKVAQFYHLRFK